MKKYMRKALAVVTCVCSIATQMQMPVFADTEKEYEIEADNGYEFVDNYPTEGDWQDGERVKNEKAIELYNKNKAVFYSTQTANRYTGQIYTHSSMFDKCTIVNGIDVSKWNGTIDWGKVKRAGIEYAIIRVGNRGVSDGSLNEDPLYEDNIRGATAAGIKVGVYIYSQAISQSEAVAEADYVLRRIKKYKITMPVVIDYEYFDGPGGRLYDAHLSVNSATNVCAAFCERVKDAGYTPMIYANASMLKNQLNAASLSRKYAIWLASWGTSNSYNGIYNHWQYTSSGKVNGINGRVDCNFWYNPVKSTGLKLSAGSKNMYVGDTYTLKETITPSDSTDIVTWSSSNPAVAYIDSEGHIVASYRGTANITAITTSGVSKSCKITVYDKMSNYNISLSDNEYIYTGTPHVPAVTVKSKDKQPVSGIVNTPLNMRVGPGTHFSIKKTGMPAGTKVVIYNSFKIDNSLWYAIRADIGNKTYYGYASAAFITQREGYRTLASSLYTKSYSSNVNAGTAKVRVTGIDASYIKGTINSTYGIVPAKISQVNITAPEEHKYTGKKIQPDISASYNNMKLKKGTDYTLTYSNNIASGNAVITVKGIGNYTGTVKKTFRIRGSRQYYLKALPDQQYTGNNVTPKVEIFDSVTNKPLSEDSYAVKYYNNINTGTAKAVITAIGKYEGTAEISFNIVNNLTNSKEITVYNIDNRQYTGQNITPEFKVMCGDKTLSSDEYSITYSSNRKLGTATAVITAGNGYTGVVAINFDIIKSDINGTDFWTNQILPMEYTGNALRPQIILENKYGSLIPGTDYEIEYSNNIKAGTATITLKGTGNYTGIRTITFNICQKSIVNSVVGDIPKQAYSGSTIRPALNITHGNEVLKEGVDYTLIFANNINKGTATVTIKGKGNYAGTISRKFEIVPRAIATATVSGVSSGIYTGKSITRIPVIKYGGKTLKKGKDYTLSFSNNVKIGEAVIKITGKGNFTGNKTVTFLITPEKVTGVTGKSVTSSSIKLKWNMNSKATGYEIYSSNSYDGKYKLIKTVPAEKIHKYTVKGLASQSELYFRIRSYKLVNGRKIYGRLSGVRAVSTPQSYTRFAYSKTKLTVRKHAGVSYDKAFTVSKNAQMRIISDTTDKMGRRWYRIKYTGKRKNYYGYVRYDMVKVEQRGTVKVDVLNVRKSTSTLSRRVTQIRYRKTVRLISAHVDSSGNRWYKIIVNTANGQKTGYVMSRYIKKY